MAYALLLLAGCDRVFALTHVNASPDAQSDVAVVVDSPMQMPCAPTTTHDEDGDGIVDNCDACPTVISTSVDTDGDGLTDACDPNISTSVDGDKILLASVFASTSELSADYTQGGATNATVSADVLTLPGGANATTVMTMTPTKIVATVAQFTPITGGGGFVDTFSIGANGVQCAISPTGCNNEAGMICISLGPPETKAVSASLISRVSLWQDTTGTHCQVDTRTPASVASSSTGMFTSSKGFAKTTINMRVVLDSLVFYGEK